MEQKQRYVVMEHMRHINILPDAFEEITTRNWIKFGERFSTKWNVRIYDWGKISGYGLLTNALEKHDRLLKDASLDMLIQATIACRLAEFNRDEIQEIVDKVYQEADVETFNEDRTYS